MRYILGGNLYSTLLSALHKDVLTPEKMYTFESNIRHENFAPIGGFSNFFAVILRAVKCLETIKCVMRVVC